MPDQQTIPRGGPSGPSANSASRGAPCPSTLPLILLVLTVTVGAATAIMLPTNPVVFASVLMCGLMVIACVIPEDAEG